MSSVNIIREDVDELDQRVICRVCLQRTQTLLTPCNCKGTIEYIHQKCLKQWIKYETAYNPSKIRIIVLDDLKEDGEYEINCPLCKYSFKFKHGRNQLEWTRKPIIALVLIIFFSLCWLTVSILFVYMGISKSEMHFIPIGCVFLLAGVILVIMMSRRLQSIFLRGQQNFQIIQLLT